MSLAASRAPTPEGERGWPRRRLWAFRFGLTLFAIQVARSLLDASPALRAVASTLHAAASLAFATVAPDAAGALARFAARGDGQRVALSLLGDVLLACVLAAAWIVVDRRHSHEKLAGAVRVLLRYLVATEMLIYGGFKVVPRQFQPPATEQLLRPLGELTPMGLMWACIGISPAYTVFAGLAESLGGALLFWRRTTTAGSVLLVGVLTNVVMLNFCYDVPVKRGAVMLLLAVLVLASRDAGRLASVLWFDRATCPGGEPPLAGPLWIRRVRAVLKPLWVCAAIAGPLAAAALIGAGHERTALDGVWSVDTFVQDGELVEALETGAGRWRRLVFDQRSGAIVQTMDHGCRRHGAVLDEGAKTLTLRPAIGPPLEFHFERSDGPTLRLRREGSGPQDIRLRLQRADEVFPLLR